MVFFAISLLKTLFRPIFDYLVTKLQYTEEIMFQCPTKINKERFLYLLSHFPKYTDKRKSRSLIYFKLWLQLKYMKRVISRCIATKNFYQEQLQMHMIACLVVEKLKSVKIYRLMIHLWKQYVIVTCGYSFILAVKRDTPSLPYWQNKSGIDLFY